MAATVLSIQGEEFTQVGERVFADPGFVYAYAQKCSDQIARCRQRVRHNYPPLPRRQIRFEKIRPDGLLERYEVCEDCGCAVQEQLWEPVLRKVKGKEVVGVRPVASKTVYQLNEDGESYVATGHGKIVPRVFREAIASQAIDGEAERWIRDAARQQAKAARKARAKVKSS